MEEYWEEDERQHHRQDEIRNSTNRQYWGRESSGRLWMVVAALAGSQIATHDGTAAGVLGGITAFIFLEAMWGAVFYIERAVVRRSRQ